jgi:hypothetical protein
MVESDPAPVELLPPPGHRTCWACNGFAKWPEAWSQSQSIHPNRLDIAKTLGFARYSNEAAPPRLGVEQAGSRAIAIDRRRDGGRVPIMAN